MKAKESNSNYQSKLREMTNYTIRETKKVCNEIGARESGEESERKAQAYIAQSMKDVADKVEIEDFEVHPKAFMGWVVIDVIMMFISILCFSLPRFGVLESAGTILNIVALVLSVFAVLFLAFEFLFYKQLLDPLFPKRKTCNVVCTRKASGETKKRIIFGGHIDSSYEWTYTHLGGAKLLKAVIILAFGSVFLNVALDIIGLFNLPEWADTTILVISLITIIPIALGLFFINWKLVVPGANDNLTGVFASMAVIRYMQDNNIRFENTDVVAVSTACEEAGLRGAKEFAKKHAGEANIETVFVAVDTLRDFEYLSVYNKDMSGLVKLDGKTSAMVKHASKIAGLDLPYSKVYFGSSDAAAVQQGGIKSTALAAMNPTPARYYHTRDDLPSILEPKTIEAGLNVMLESAFLFDEAGLRDEY